MTASCLIQNVLHHLIFLKIVEALRSDELLHQLLNFNRVGFVLNDLRKLNPVNFVILALDKIVNHFFLLHEERLKILWALVVAEILYEALVTQHQVGNSVLLHIYTKINLF